MEILFAHEKFLHGKILSGNSLSQTPATRDVPLKISVYFLIINTIREQWAEFITCSPSPGDCGGLNRPQRHNYYIFDYFE